MELEELRKKFLHGRLVLCTHEWDDKEEIVNQFGQIFIGYCDYLELSFITTLPINFIYPMGGHSLSDTVEDGYGWNTAKKCLKIYPFTIDKAEMKLIEGNIITIEEFINKKGGTTYERVTHGDVTTWPIPTMSAEMVL